MLQGQWFGTGPLVVGRISDPAGPDNAIGYGAYVYSHEARASLARHRWYDPLLGRWWQRDPAGYVDGMSLYEYVRSGPIGGWDPYGLESWIGSYMSWVSDGYDLLWDGHRDAPRPATNAFNTYKKARDPCKRFGEDMFSGHDANYGDAALLELHNRQIRMVDTGASEASAAIKDQYVTGVVVSAIVGGTAITAGAAMMADDAAGLGRLGSAASNATERMDPASIRFSQSSISDTFGDGRSIDELAEGLRKGTIKPNDVPPVRVVNKDGQMYTLDNRRLEAFRRAGVPIPYRTATPEAAAKEGWKFTTKNEGASIRIRKKE